MISGENVPVAVATGRFSIYLFAVLVVITVFHFIVDTMVHACQCSHCRAGQDHGEKPWEPK
jgi:hypothetical protein